MLINIIVICIKDKPFKMYKIFEEIYYSRDYNSIKAYHVLRRNSKSF